MIYRREIDGLRAVAVMAVILYHARIPGFTGGFTGVDVFFVISGFLITNIILCEMSEHTFSIARFYERRARRILPALFTVIAAALIPAWLWLTPAEMVGFGDSVKAVGVFVSNLLFWQDSDYFAPTADFKPLLHTWSLSLEEQFYIVFPVFLVLTRRLPRRWVAAALAVGALISLAAAEKLVHERPVAVFYLPPTRVWELMAGAILAFAVRKQPLYHRLHPAFSEAAALAGLVSIVAAALLFDTHTPFPGLSAVVPVGGAWLVLAFAHPHTQVGRLLGHPLLVHVGLISYSLYLWHHPVFVFARLTLGFALGPAKIAGLLALSFLLAELSWRYVERPFRHRWVISRRGIFVFSILATAGFVALGQLAVTHAGWPDRLGSEQRRIAEWLRYPVTDLYRTRQCFLDPDQGVAELAAECFQGTVALWGDSHAASLYSGLADIVPTAQFTASACPPIVGYSAPARPLCPTVNATVFDQLARRGPTRVIMLANWRAYLHDPAFAPLFVATLRRMAAAGLTPVVVGSLPQWHPSLPRVWMRTPDQRGELPAAALPELSRADAYIQALAREGGARYVSVLDHQCKAEQCTAVLAGADGTFTPMAWDYGHLTREGAASLAARLRSELLDPMP